MGYLKYFLMIPLLLFLSPVYAQIPILDEESLTVDFSGYEWQIKTGGPFGPGANLWDAEDVLIDSLGQMHLVCRNDALGCHCGEVYLTEPLGYGTYRARMAGAFDLMHPEVIAAFFLYADDEHEIDVIERINTVDDKAYIIHTLQPSDDDCTRPFITTVRDFIAELVWTEKSALFRVYDIDEETILSEWEYDGPKLPEEADKPLVVFNAWLKDRGEGKPEGRWEFIIRNFSFKPLGE